MWRISAALPAAVPLSTRLEWLREESAAVAEQFLDEYCPLVPRVFKDEIAQLEQELAEWLKLLADNRAAVVASGLERNFIVGTFRHVLRLPLSFFTRRSSGAVARQVDQSDSVAPIVTAAIQQFWPDFFRLVAILAVLGTLPRQVSHGFLDSGTGKTRGR